MTYTAEHSVELWSRLEQERSDVVRKWTWDCVCGRVGSPDLSFVEARRQAAAHEALRDEARSDRT